MATEFLTLDEVAAREGWTDEQVAAERARCDAEPEYAPTAGDLVRLAELATAAGDTDAAARFRRWALRVIAADLEPSNLAEHAARKRLAEAGLLPLDLADVLGAVAEALGGQGEGRGHAAAS